MNKMVTKSKTSRDLEYATRTGNTSSVAWDLHSAIRLGEMGRIKELIEKEAADPNEIFSDGSTALTTATGFGNIFVVSCLVEHKADVNSKDNYGMTAVMWAAANGHLDIVEYLVQHGADVKKVDKGGNTATKWAVRDKWPEIVEYLEMDEQKKSRNDGKYYKEDNSIHMGNNSNARSEELRKFWNAMRESDDGESNGNG